MALVYSSGFEVIIGSFYEGVFKYNLVDLDERGYSNPSSFISPEYIYKPRERVWDYLLFNYKDEISKAGLINQFYLEGEEAAKQICAHLREQIYVNTCAKCDHIKKKHHTLVFV